MSTEMTPEALLVLERYLRRVRTSLSGTSVDAAEVERDVMDHIEAALNGNGEPVGVRELNDVLERLGAPDQWVPEEESPLWRRAMARLRGGPEDWRLPYLCFGLTALGIITAPIGGLLLWIPAYVLGRAAHALAAELGEELGARRWLTDPPLVVVALAIVVAVLIGPLAPGVLALVVENDLVGEMLAGPLTEAREIAATIALGVAALGVWWMLLAPILALAIRPVRVLLVPIGGRFRRRHAVWLGVLGLVLTVLAAAAFLAI